jgi:hypothetical protein
MKTIIILISLLLAPACFAQSSFERDLTKLTEDRDKALVRVSDPIQRKYKESLEQLMQRATRNGDLDAAIKIKDAIAKIPVSIIVTKPHPKTAQELKEFLDGTIWEISDKTPTGKVLYTLTFNKNGTFIHSEGRTGIFEVSGPNDFKMWGFDPATLNEDFNQFRAVGSATVYFGRLKTD